MPATGPAGNAPGWADGALSVGTQVAQLSAAPTVQQACGWLQQPMAAAAMATLELHSTVPSSHATKQRCIKRCGLWRLNIFNILVSLIDARYSYKLVCSKPSAARCVVSEGHLRWFLSTARCGRQRLQHGFGYAAQDVDFFVAQVGAVEQRVQAGHELFRCCWVEVANVHQGLL